jgi:hypothetical protein
MKQLATLAFLGVLALGLAKPATATTPSLLVDYVGFDYEDPNLNPGTFGELGSGYVSLGNCPGVFAPLVADTSLNEYTYVINGLTAINVTPIGPDFIVVDYSTGTFSLYEDSKSGGTVATFGVNPPNGTAPSTFTDGTKILSGTLSNFQIVYNVTAGSGSFEGQLTFDGGTQLSNLPLNQRDGWTFSGLSGNSTEVPTGYAHQVDGQVFLNKPTPTQKSSWGGLKSRYR